MADEAELPSGARIVEQLGIRVDQPHPRRPSQREGDILTGLAEETLRYMPTLWEGWTLVRRDVVDWHGPWTPVDADLVTPPPTINEESTDG